MILPNQARWLLLTAQRTPVRSQQASSTFRRSLASVASPRTDTGESIRNDMSYSMSFSESPEAEFYFKNRLTSTMKRQLLNSKNQLKHNIYTRDSNKISSLSSSSRNSALPKTLEDVMRQKSRAIVVTETDKPFRVVDVNSCWEGLCGYSFVEARGKTLGSLLNGPDTNQVAATSLVSHLLRGEEAGAVVTNYTKDGREFKNRIRVGPIYDDNRNITHYVGVLQEIKEES